MYAPQFPVQSIPLPRIYLKIRSLQRCSSLHKVSCIRPVPCIITAPCHNNQFPTEAQSLHSQFPSLDQMKLPQWMYMPHNNLHISQTQNNHVLINSTSILPKFLPSNELICNYIIIPWPAHPKHQILFKTSPNLDTDPLQELTANAIRTNCPVNILAS